eukprot:TRINITY_DN4365_c0_g1_i1.p1 TRINITY_DN4365_c0_g1~~TRINITY_DN4365_c0_g1_i1.p1  ORF type:complete len:788 (-),score=293.87 TRINITY_DN4365_c0_g1_i1:118-2481(-)
MMHHQDDAKGHHHHHHHLHSSNNGNSRRMDMEDGKRWRNHNNSHHHNNNNNGNSGNHHGNKRYGRDNYNMRRHMRESEPEWMSASISHGDIIELRGFDDDDNNNVHESRKKDEESSRNKKKDSGGKQGRKGPAKEVTKTPPPPVQEDPPTKPCDPLQIMDLLDLSSIPNFSESLLTDGGLSNGPEGGSSSNGGGNNGGSTQKKESRFSKFFRQQENSLDLSVQQQQQDAKQPTDPSSLVPGRTAMIRIPSPGDSQNYFAPISPAAPTKVSEALRRNLPGNNTQPQHNSDNNGMNNNGSGGGPYNQNALMEMLRLGGIHGDKGDHAQEEEALKDSSPWNSEPTHHHQPPFTPEDEGGRPNENAAASTNEGDLSAFKKFAALVQGNQQDNNLPQALRQVQQQEQQRHQLPPQLQAPGFGLLRPSPIPANAPTENDILMGSSGTHNPRYPLPPRFPPHFPPQHHRAAPRFPPNPQDLNELSQLIHSTPINPYFRKFVGVENLLLDLNRGIITHAMLLQELLHGSPSPSRKLFLFNVLKHEMLNGNLPQPTAAALNNGGGGHHHIHPHPPPPHHVLHHQQPLAPPHQMRPYNPPAAAAAAAAPSGEALLYALNPQAGSPSPQSHKHPQQQQHSNSKKSEEGSPLVFTPTVVIKRMAADRRDSDPKGASSEHTTNSNGGCSASKQMSEDGNHASTTTLKRLFGGNNHHNNHHNNHPLPSPNNGGGGNPPIIMNGAAFMSAHMGGGSSAEDGLSRFFTPDVLAQASSGNMPSMPPLPTKKALTLEELENLQLV